MNMVGQDLRYKILFLVIKKGESMESKSGNIGRKRVTDERIDREIAQAVAGSAEKTQKK